MKKYVKEVEKDSVKDVMKKLDRCMGLIDEVKGNVNLRIYTSGDLCEMLQINEKLLRKYRYDGKLSYSRVGDKYWYTQQDIDEFMEKNHRDTF